MTLDELMNFLLNHLHVGQREAAFAVQTAAKMIAFKYESELFKVFTKDDVSKANQLGEAESQAYLHKRYEEITGEKSDKLLNSIISEVVSDIMKQPRDFFHFSEQV